MKQMLFGPVAGFFVRARAIRTPTGRFRGTFHVFAQHPEQTRESNFVSLGETPCKETTASALLEAAQLGVQEVGWIHGLMTRNRSTTSR